MSGTDLKIVSTAFLYLNDQMVTNFLPSANQFILYTQK